MSNDRDWSRAGRKPPWLTVRSFGSAQYQRTNALVKSLGLNTVCYEANCPNRGDCFHRGTAAFLLLGPRCTRRCGFCGVVSGYPAAPDSTEPARIARAAQRLGLRHVVITSVTRDDLGDGGAAHFAATVRAIRFALPDSTVEVLTPDFRGSHKALAAVMSARPDIFNHNIETVPRLYSSVRPGADYGRSLRLLRRARARYKALTKSGLMVGLGETMPELKQVFGELADCGVSILTVGQYLSPSSHHLPVIRYFYPDEFSLLEQEARHAGIPTVLSGPLVRSSYLADIIASRQ